MVVVSCTDAYPHVLSLEAETSMLGLAFVGVMHACHAEHPEDLRTSEAETSMLGLAFLGAMRACRNAHPDRLYNRFKPANAATLYASASVG